MSNKLTPEEKEFLDYLHDYAQGSLNPESLQKIFLDKLYKLIDLRINPPKEVYRLKTLEEHNISRAKAHDAMFGRYIPKPNGIACPKCGTELIDSDPTTTLASNPPQKNTKCPNCDYTGYRIA